MSEIGLACSGSNEASRQNKIKVMPNFIVSTETFIFFQIWLIDSLTHWLIDSLTHWLMTHDSLTHLTHKTSVVRIVASFGGYFACRFYPLKLLKCRARYDFRLSCVLKKRRFWARSIQPKFRPVRPGKEDHLKRWTSFFETFPVGPNLSIEFWTEISGNFGWMDRALWNSWERFVSSSLSTFKMAVHF